MIISCVSPSNVQFKWYHGRGEEEEEEEEEGAASFSVAKWIPIPEFILSWDGRLVKA